jgi:DNA-binding MarR family transcriptional regulator
MDEIASMGLVYALWRRRASRVLAASGISLNQLQLIQLARRRGAISLSAAAEELSWDRPTTTLVARKCVAGKWLFLKRSAADRRSSRLSLSGEGEELLDKLEAARALAPESLGDPLDLLDSTERAELGRMLDKVLRRARDVL